jgi:hypothetical protein
MPLNASLGVASVGEASRSARMAVEYRVPGMATAQLRFNPLSPRREAP